MTDRSSCYIRHPNAQNCRRRRGNSLDLMLCDGLWKVLCISTWRLFYAFPQTVVERDREQTGRPAHWQLKSIKVRIRDMRFRLNRSLNRAPAPAIVCNPDAASRPIIRCSLDQIAL